MPQGLLPAGSAKTSTACSRKLSCGDTHAVRLIELRLTKGSECVHARFLTLGFGQQAKKPLILFSGIQNENFMVMRR